MLCCPNLLVLRWEAVCYDGSILIVSKMPVKTNEIWDSEPHNKSVDKSYNWGCHLPKHIISNLEFGKTPI